MARALSFLVESELGSSFLFEHDLFRKPVPTFRDHALSAEQTGHARPRRPAASSRLMLIKDTSLSGRGSAVSEIVWFMTNRPRLATFCRIRSGSGFSGRVTDVRKIDQSLRLYRSASASPAFFWSQPSRTACRRAAALSNRFASSSRGLEISLATLP